MENNSVVRAFYASVYQEDSREERESLEYLRSKAIITRYLTKESLNIADVGGATGAYSFWLAEKGHRVHLLDLMQNHIDIAKQKSITNGIELASYVCADARELPYANESMDVVLLMGALYHLHSKESRIKCLREAIRVVKPGGKLICTVINRYMGIIAGIKYKLDDEYLEEAISVINTGKWSKANFYHHIISEAVEEVSEAGFDQIESIAVEGIGNALTNNQIPESKEEAGRLLRCIELTEKVPELLGASRNLMVIGTKPASLLQQL